MLTIFTSETHETGCNTNCCYINQNRILNKIANLQAV